LRKDRLETTSQREDDAGLKLATALALNNLEVGLPQCSGLEAIGLLLTGIEFLISARVNVIPDKGQSSFRLCGLESPFGSRSFALLPFNQWHSTNLCQVQVPVQFRLVSQCLALSTNISSSQISSPSTICDVVSRENWLLILGILSRRQDIHPDRLSRPICLHRSL
jgi:hypothetical protein